MVAMGDKLKNLRLQQNLTQKQIADRIGVAVSSISEYESGVRYPSYDSLVKLARIYHCSADYLLGLSNQNEVDLSGLTDEEIDAVLNLIKAMKHH
ncbi:MAG: helix-turn-helix domain-containing protein [Lachnospiraceae bacterium]|nr:helix-turn-helix domain-containing protein [Lachnospiraceae bacterium]